MKESHTAVTTVMLLLLAQNPQLEPDLIGP